MAQEINNKVSRQGTAALSELCFEEIVKKALKGYVSSEQLMRDLNELKASERIKFMEEMVPYFMPKLKEGGEEEKMVGGWTEDEEKYYRRFYPEKLPSDSPAVDDYGNPVR
ncbi:MAG: hypothetical protein LUC88_10910 [Prevotella sp.]|nr:hypothetical protein [Prevotella sp.]